jgi:hypothetical protein
VPGRFAHCFACRTVARLLHLPLTPVLPVHLCPAPGPLYRVLMGYKESPVDEARRRFSRCVGERFAAFCTVHGRCVMVSLGGTAELVLPVPSTRRPGPAPLERVGGLADMVLATVGGPAAWRPSLLRRSGAPVGHMRPHPEAYMIDPADFASVRGSRVLLLDDTYVSGARAQSAAAALRRCGARSTLIVPLGRLLRPDRSGAHGAFVAEDHGSTERCARCVRPQTAAGTE